MPEEYSRSAHIQDVPENTDSNVIGHVNGGQEHSEIHAHSHSHTHKETKNVLNRMSRIIGHMNAVKKMIESGRDCSDVLVQLSAIDAAIKSLSSVILKDHISSCIVDAVKTGDEETLQELYKAIDKLMK